MRANQPSDLLIEENIGYKQADAQMAGTMAT